MTDRIGLYPGSFDPITNGHIDIIKRSLRVVDKLVIGIAVNVGKTGLFSLKEREKLVLSDIKNLGFEKFVEVRSFEGLLVDFAEQEKANVIVRGLRAFSDFENEFQMALTNRQMKPKIETLFLMPKQDYSYVSSSNVREVAQMGGNINQFVPEYVQSALKRKFS